MVPAVEGLPPSEAHGRVCEFVRECVAHGVPTECTIVDRDDVDVPRAQDLATRLGTSFRVRPYFPLERPRSRLHSTERESASSLER